MTMSFFYLRIPIAVFQKDCSLLLFCLSLFTDLLYFVLPPFEDNGLLSGSLMSSASDEKLFCEVCSVVNCSFDESVGEKVVSPSYSSAIWLLPLFTDLLTKITVRHLIYP